MTFIPGETARHRPPTGTGTGHGPKNVMPRSNQCWLEWEIAAFPKAQRQPLTRPDQADVPSDHRIDFLCPKTHARRGSECSEADLAESQRGTGAQARPMPCFTALPLTAVTFDVGLVEDPRATSPLLRSILLLYEKSHSRSLRCACARDLVPSTAVVPKITKYCVRFTPSPSSVRGRPRRLCRETLPLTAEVATLRSNAVPVPERRPRALASALPHTGSVTPVQPLRHPGLRSQLFALPLAALCQRWELLSPTP